MRHRLTDPEAHDAAVAEDRDLYDPRPSCDGCGDHLPAGGICLSCLADDTVNGELVFEPDAAGDMSLWMPTDADPILVASKAGVTAAVWQLLQTAVRVAPILDQVRADHAEQAAQNHLAAHPDATKDQLMSVRRQAWAEFGHHYGLAAGREVDGRNG